MLQSFIISNHIIFYDTSLLHDIALLYFMTHLYFMILHYYIQYNITLLEEILISSDFEHYAFKDDEEHPQFFKCRTLFIIFVGPTQFIDVYLTNVLI